MNGSQQLRVIEGFREEFSRPAFHGADRGRHIPMTRNKNNWRRIPVSQLLLKIQAAGSGELQVEDQASCSIWLFESQELRRRTEDSRSKSSRPDETRQRLAHARVVVHHVNNEVLSFHCGAPG